MYSLTWLTILEDTNEPEVAVLALYRSQTRTEMRKFAIIEGVASVSFLDLLAPLNLSAQVLPVPLRV